MTVSLQLTPWALPCVLAVLVVLRDLVYLGPRWRERSVPPLLALAALAGLWAALHALGAVATGAAAKAALHRAEYLPALLVPVALFVFACLQARRKDLLKAWPAVALYVVTVAGVVSVLNDGAYGLVVSGTELQSADGLDELVVAFGFAHWLFVGLRVAVCLGAAWILLRVPARRRREKLGQGLVAVAMALVLAPAVLEMMPGVGSHASDLSPVAFALAGAALSIALLRPRLLGVGPVARTLVMDALRDPIVVFDGKGRIVDVNRAAEHQLLLRPFGSVPLALGTLWASSRQEAKQATSVTLPVQSEDDEAEVRTFDVTVTHLVERGAPSRSALLLRDVTARDRMERELRRTTGALETANEDLKRLANTDPLTGLANRRHFMEALEQEMERSARYERPLSLVLLDLDHFKRVNDTYGHAAGDDVLRAASTVLKAACRDVDIAARLGGEELTLLLPETDSEGARIVAERVRDEIERWHHRSPDGVPFRVTASIGVASAHSPDETGEQLMQASDEALYEAKDGGRNRVVVAS